MKLPVIRAALLLLSLWLASCSSSAPQGPDEQPAEQPAEQAADDAAGDPGRQATDSDVIPVGESPILGDASAPVTVVVFSDLQCPFCQRGAETMRELQQNHPEDVRVVYKHFPLPFHKQADDAARAAIAAGNQGKFWEMHDWLFDNFKQFKDHSGDMKEWTAAYAHELGLDVVVFERDFDAAATKKTIDDDMALGKKLGVKGTPHFFVNGERVSGARPLQAFEEVVARQLRNTRELQEDGVATAELYKEAVAENYEQPPERPTRKRKPATTVEYIPVDADDPMFGNAKDPLVTIVEFSDFQCPFCGKVIPTLDRIKKEYGDQVRVVFKQLPLGMHPQAEPAARAALAAHQQGLFWEMHDTLFEEQREMRQHGDDFEAWAAGLAKSLGMNVDQFEKDFASDKIAQQVKDDLALSQRIGVRGTPNFWINGVNLRGAQPFDRFKALIDKQILAAEKVQKDKGLSGDALYKEVVAANKAAYADGSKGHAKPSRAQKPADKVDVSKLELGSAPVKGPKDAPVTIVAFSDFQCPYCSRGGQTVFEAMKEFPGQVNLAFKHYPLPFHKQAKDAAKAAMAAGEQGKFWQMHDNLFEEQRRLREDGIFQELAKEIGLDMETFEEDMANPEYDKIIARDMAQGQAVGVRGTPAFFINGTRVVGAQPAIKFEKAIEEALEEQ